MATWLTLREALPAKTGWKAYGPHFLNVSSCTLRRLYPSVLLSMHLTRPKSSKGRSRSAVNNSAVGDRIQRPAESPESPASACSRPDRNLSFHSPIKWQVGQLIQDRVLRQDPPQSLNRYKVLPSIVRRQTEASPERSLDKTMSELKLSNDATPQRGHREPRVTGVTDVTRISGSEVDQRDGVRSKPPDTGQTMSGEAGSLLLAIRAPCGRRFQQHFDPADSLLTVRTSAELRYEAEYGGARIETMDVPRRTFTDMDLTLAQCGILNRSVLCISQNDL